MQLAAVIALANQKRHNMNKGPVGSLNFLLSGLSSSDFNDIVPQMFGSSSGQTLDNNTAFGTGTPGMLTLTGYDLATGRGSPKVDKFVVDLASH